MQTTMSSPKTSPKNVGKTSDKNVKENLGKMARDLASTIEKVLGEELELQDFTLPVDLERVAGEMDGNMCIIENSAWQSKAFRKIHIELATFLTSSGEGSGLDILHVVMFPRYEVAGPSVPMFGCDVVCVRGQVTAAIVDLSPMSREKKLSADYIKAYDKACRGLTEFEEPRDIPEFGSHIFGDRCVFVRPSGKDECDRFIKLCGEVLKVHCRQSTKVVEEASLTPDEVAEALEAQNLYCEKQCENEKTRRILEGSFGVEWTDRYMETLLFDKPVVQ